MHANTVIQQVPVNYYQRGIQTNILQRWWHTNKLRIVQSFIKHPPKRILDVGCASGWFLSELATRYPQATCVGVDSYKEAIEYGSTLYPHLCLLRASASNIPLPSHTFDCIVCTEVLEHIPDPQEVIREIRRLLAPGGVAVIEMDTGNTLFQLVWRIWTSLKGRVWQGAHVYQFTSKSLEEMIRKEHCIIKKKKTFNLSMAIIFLITA